ncbi:MAG: hypothetical protein ACRDPC_16065 [Solirubrobacteraceae bacterium]
MPSELLREREQLLVVARKPRIPLGLFDRRVLIGRGAFEPLCELRQRARRAKRRADAINRGGRSLGDLLPCLLRGVEQQPGEGDSRAAHVHAADRPQNVCLAGLAGVVPEKRLVEGLHEDRAAIAPPKRVRVHQRLQSLLGDRQALAASEVGSRGQAIT